MRRVAVLVLVAAASCRAVDDPGEGTAGRFLVDPAHTTFELHDVGHAGGFAFDEAATGRRLDVAYVVTGTDVTLSFPIEGSSEGASVTAGFDTSGRARLIFGSALVVDATFLRDGAGVVDATFEVVAH
ncbi:MAG: hypothetical protein R3F34_13965 [Planctomycetota bacterium]